MSDTRPPFAPSPRPVVCLPLQPSWMLGARAYSAAMRRIWQVKPSQMSPLCWRWVTKGFGPPWQGDEGRPMSRYAMHNPEDPMMERAIDRADLAKTEMRERDVPPFVPGDKVILIDDPQYGMVDVTAMQKTPFGWRASYTIGPHTWGSASADWFMLAPEGWQDPPLRPVGSPRYGLTEADRIAAQEQDDADVELQERLAKWRTAMEEWIEKVGPSSGHPRGEGRGKLSKPVWTLGRGA